jgi:two-component system, OmpR family, response regulator CpxR
MRPKKVILLVDSDEVRASTVAFMLTTNGYRVVHAYHAHMATVIAAGTMFDVFLSRSTLNYVKAAQSGYDLAVELKRIAPFVPLALILSKGDVAREFHEADRLIPGETLSSTDLLDHVKILTTRKRGPRRRSAVAETCEPAILAEVMA